MTPEWTVSCLVPAPAQDSSGTKEPTAMPILCCRRCKCRAEFSWQGRIPSCSICGSTTTYAQFIETDFDGCPGLAALRADLETGLRGEVETIWLHGCSPVHRSCRP